MGVSAASATLDSGCERVATPSRAQVSEQHGGYDEKTAGPGKRCQAALSHQSGHNGRRDRSMVIMTAALAAVRALWAQACTANPRQVAASAR